MQQNINSLYVWGQSAQLIHPDNEELRKEFFKFLEKPHSVCSPINRLYFEADRDNLYGSQAELLKAFIQECHSHGVAVEYLDGQPKWLLSDEKTQVPVDICYEIVAFNNSCSNPLQCFDSIHFDIEPHVLGADVWRDTSNNLTIEQFDASPKLANDVVWKLLFSAKKELAIKNPNSSTGNGSRYNDVIKQRFLNILYQCSSIIKKYNNTINNNDKRQLTLSIDLGTDYYFYVTDLWTVLTDPTLNLVNFICIMNYFSDSTRFINGNNGIGGMLANISHFPSTPSSNCKLVFAIETIQPPSGQ